MVVYNLEKSYAHGAFIMFIMPNTVLYLEGHYLKVAVEV